MAFFKFKDIGITGIETAVPQKKVRTEDFITEFGEKHIHRFIRSTGVQERHIAEKHQTASDLGYVAAVDLMQHKEICQDEIGALVFASHGPDYRRPATAYVLQKRLGLSRECACMDINLGCSAFVYGTQAVCGLMKNSDIKKALLIVGDTNSKLTYPKDESMVLITGDAGSAILFETQKGSEITAELLSDGKYFKEVIVPAGGMRNLSANKEPLIFQDGNERTLYHLFMDGFGVLQYTIHEVPDAVRAFIKHEKKTLKDYDYYFMHQANQYILQQL
ncbi:MAG: ketoacyl-ACP synthase III, partial [Ruminococcus flavefaciens]|nr:ketoacyl-ACP synthase III [Ruminococcus flavefaciens]